MEQQSNTVAPRSSLDGLWVVLVNSDPGQQPPRIPMMARAGNDDTYLLGFKNMHNARKFLKDSAIEDAEPRMVVRGNKGELLEVARANGVVGVLVDYDPATQQYSSAAELF
jgi:hypothetical protein